MSAVATLSANASSTSGSRSRPQARKKPNDDAAYFGVAGTKRQAADRAEGEPRVKRKRVEHNTTVSRRADKSADNDLKSAIDFRNMSTAGLYRYLSHFSLIPPVYPSPLIAADPPSPDSLLDPVRQNPRGLSPFTTISTSGNRLRRDTKDPSRRRSSRLLEENESRTPILADIAEIQTILAAIAERHFQDHAVSEIDTLASFMVKTSTKYE
ncbi:uncharacterized protein EDB93DRAFT_1074561 [Suillus bovinus]|uniref:uncharacterized protein n=1 Tax=Suillus bovinus TaxID=48563 RepID=UPI001B871CDA|nr:uncharacterized protein EDB93DRAFT_1074561 [Suillus bovinus]KAG2160235.1 hypothetical protein EDB93DRAFT_1074561 [Suillus bovinus]